MGHSQLKKIPAGELEKHVRAAQKGSDEAFTWLVTQTKDRLLRFLFFLSGNAAIAQDSCQDTYLYALEHLKELKEPGAFPRWLFLVAKNRFFDHRKSSRNKPHQEIEAVEKLGVFRAPHDQELWLQVNRAMLLLRAEERTILLLVDMEGYTYAEAAKVLGVSESAITSRLYRAREAFHQIFFKS